MRYRIYKKREPVFLLCADLHIRGTVPICRTDNYLETQDMKLDKLTGIAKQYEIPILCAGDFSNSAEWPNWLLAMAMSKFKGIEIHTILGQHDIFNHRIESWLQSGLKVLSRGRFAHVHPFKQHRLLQVKGLQYAIDFRSYGESIKSKKNERQKDIPNIKRILIAHHMIIRNKPLWPGQIAETGKQFLKRHSNYNLILTGDNHESFISKYEDRVLVNPGSMMRMRSDQYDHQPKMFLWFSDESIEAINWPINKEAISLEQKEEDEEREERVEAYITHMKKRYDVGLSFIDNMKKKIEMNKTKKKIKRKVWKAIRGGKNE